MTPLDCALVAIVGFVFGWLLGAVGGYMLAVFDRRASSGGEHNRC